MTNIRRKRIGLLSTLSVLALCTTGSASASISPPRVAGAGTMRAYFNLPYDGTDPIATGCGNTATTPRYTQTPFGTLYLRWSTACKTNWGRFVGNGLAACFAKVTKLPPQSEENTASGFFAS